MLAIVEGINRKSLYEEVEGLNEVDKPSKDKIISFLEKEGIDNLDQINENNIKKFILEIQSDFSLKPRQVSFFRGALERALREYRRPMFRDLYEDLLALDVPDPNDKRNKIFSFLTQEGVHNVEEINFDLRKKFETYIKTYKQTKYSEYMKAFDLLKLNSIKVMGWNEPKELTDPNEKIFLLYHPDYELAMTFYYVQDKEDLLFDLSVHAPSRLKEQTLSFLNFILKEKTDWKERRERFIMPLKRFFKICVERRVADINDLEIEDIEAYRASLKGNVGTQESLYMQIVNNFKKFVFINAKRINYDANTWFFDRIINDDVARSNPARLIERVDFSEIKNAENRRMFKMYIEHLVGNTDRSAQTIRNKFYKIGRFLKFADEQSVGLDELNPSVMCRFFEMINKEGKKEGTVNQYVMALSCFLWELRAKNEIAPNGIIMEQYCQKEYKQHNNLALSVDEMEDECRVASKSLRYKEFLMYLILRSTGLRASEVCCLRGGAFIESDGDYFIDASCIKMHNDKKIPIPGITFLLTKKYIFEEKICPNEYIFKGARTKVYRVDEFTQTVKDAFKPYGIEFKSHASRHSIATLMIAAGVDIQTIREYLGHRSTDMTQQYIDNIEKRTEKAIREMLTSEKRNYNQ